MWVGKGRHGYLLMTAIGLHKMDTIMAVTLLLVIFATTINSILLIVDHRLHGHT